MTRITSAVRKPKTEVVRVVPTVTFIFVPAKLNVLQHWNLPLDSEGSPVGVLSPPSISKESFLPLLSVTKVELLASAVDTPMLLSAIAWAF